MVAAKMYPAVLEASQATRAPRILTQWSYVDADDLADLVVPAPGR